MQLRSTVVAMIIAAAAGGAAVRAFGPHKPAGPSAVSLADAERRPAAASDVVPQTDVVNVLPATHVSGHAAASGATLMVYVAGAVMRPGVYALRGSARANDALHAAGGPAPNADLVAVNLAARLADGEEIAVPLRGATEASGGDVTARVTRRRTARTHRGSKGRSRRKRRTNAAAGSADPIDAADAPAEVVDINVASEVELETLPGVGPALAERIVAFRDLNGPFASSDELLDVGGMTAGKVDALSPYVSFQ